MPTRKRGFRWGCVLVLHPQPRVVDLPGIVPMERLIGLADPHEDLRVTRLAIRIRMVLLRELDEGPLDLPVGGAHRHIQHLVVVLDPSMGIRHRVALVREPGAIAGQAAYLLAGTGLDGPQHSRKFCKSQTVTLKILNF